MRDPYFENFVNLVSRHRQAIKDYETHGLPESFKTAKALGKEIDAFITDHILDNNLYHVRSR